MFSIFTVYFHRRGISKLLQGFGVATMRHYSIKHLAYAFLLQVPTNQRFCVVKTLPQTKLTNSSVSVFPLESLMAN